MLSPRTRKLLLVAVATLTIPLLGVLVAVPGGASVAVALAPAPPKNPQPNDTPPVVCSPDQPGCVASTGVPSSPGGPGGGGSGGGGGQRVCTYKGEVVLCYDPQLGYYDQGNSCYYLYETPQPPTGDPSREGHPVGDGAVYLTTCLDAKGPGGPINNQFTTWLPDPPPGQPNAPTNGERALEIVKNMGVTGPNMETVPKPAGVGLVGLPVWMWSDPARAGQFIWGRHQVTIAVPGVTLTVTATATVENWNMGDGTTVHCRATGQAYNPPSNPPGATSPNCGYVYTQPGTYTVTSSTRWRVTWTATDGTAGTLTYVAPGLPGTFTLTIHQLEVVTQ